MRAERVIRIDKGERAEQSVRIHPRCDFRIRRLSVGRKKADQHRPGPNAFEHPARGLRMLSRVWPGEWGSYRRGRNVAGAVPAAHHGKRCACPTKEKAAERITRPAASN